MNGIDHGGAYSFTSLHSGARDADIVCACESPRLPPWMKSGDVAAKW